MSPIRSVMTASVLFGAMFLLGLTPKAFAEDSKPLRIAVISDFNGPYGATYYNREIPLAMDRILELKPDLVITTGDMISSEKSSLTNENVRLMWSSFHSVVTERLERAGIPFATTPGNHDASIWKNHARDRVMYEETWRTRKPQLEYIDDSHYPFYYAFTQGPALFLSLDATRGGPLDPPQMKWVKSILEANPSYTVKILFSHVPLYPFAIQREDDYLQDPEFERYLVQQGVTMYLSGHHHAYYPGKRGSLRLVGTSCIGDGARRWIGSDKISPKSFLWLELDSSGVRSLEALEAPTFDHVIPRSSVPPFIGQGALRIDRDDL